METKKAVKQEVSVTGEIEFTKEQLGYINIIMSRSSNEPNPMTGMFPAYNPEKGDQLTAYEIFRDIDKCEKDGYYIDGKVAFGTQQKALILKRLEDYPHAARDLKNKFELIEKLK